jgi:hypothetical protein
VFPFAAFGSHTCTGECDGLQEALEAMQQGQAPAPEHDAYAYAAAQPPQPASAANLTTASAAATLRARAVSLHDFARFDKPLSE